ncbi:MAG: PAS domain S-box protein [Acidobacteria bacterium]|nr:MAG: PAS domain S-box protein [Acidobacteriota bacterium]
MGKRRERTEESFAKELSDLRRRLSELEAVHADLQRAKEQLARSEERFRAFIENSSEGIWCFEAAEPIPIDLDEREIIDRIYATGRLVECNDTMARMYGRTRGEELLGIPLRDLLPPDDERNIDYLRRFIRCGFRLTDAESYERDVRGNLRVFLNNLIGIVENGCLVRAWGTQRDITEQKKMQEALRRSEAQYRNLVEASPEIIFTLDPARGVITSLNPAFERELGYSREDWLGMPVEALMHPDDRSAMAETIRRAVRERVPVLCEARWRAASGAYAVFEFNIAVHTRAGGEAHILGVARDITERKRAEETRRVLEEKYVKAFRASPDAISLSTLEEGRYLEVNEGFLQVSGYRREEVIGRTALELGIWVDVKDRERMVRSLRERGTVRNLEFAFRRKSGEIRVGLLSAEIIELEGKPCLLAVAKDITELKRAERIQASIYKISEAAHAAENLDDLFRLIHEIISELMPAENFYIALHDERTGLISFPYFVDQHDPRPAPKKPGKGLTEYVLRTGQPLLASPEVFAELVNKGEVELIGTHSIDWLGVPLKVRERTIGALVVQSYSEGIRFTEKEKEILLFVSSQVAMAIERKQAELALRESEEKYRELVENINDVIFSVDARGIITYISPTIEQASGYSPSEVIGRPFVEFVYPGDRALLMESFQKTCAGELGPLEFQVVAKSGEVRWVRSSSRPILHQGQLIGVQGVITDITERKKAEMALRASEERYRDLVENANDIIYTHDLEGNITSANAAAVKTYHYRHDEIVGKNIKHIVDPAYLPVAMENLRKKLAGVERTGPYELLTYTKEGTPVWVEVNTRLIYEGDRPVGVQGIARDITERKRAEEQWRWRIEQVTRHQQALLELARMDVANLDLALRTITEIDARTLGVERVSVWLFDEPRSAIRCQDLYLLSQDKHEGGMQLEASRYPRYFAALEESRTIAADDVRQDPRTNEFVEEYLEPYGITSMLDVPVRLHGRVVGVVCHEHTGSRREWTLEEQDFAASVADFVSLVLETAERRRAEAALRESEERYRDLVEGVDAIVWECDPETMRFTFVSERARDILGYPVERWLTEKDFWIRHVHPDDRDAVIDAFLAAARQGQHHEIEYRAMAADGRIVWLRNIVRVVRADRGTIRQIRGLMIDITEHKRMEEELLKAQKLESLSILAGGIAHDFNNLLMGILGNLSLARLSVSPGDKLNERLEAAEKATLRARDLTQQLLTFAKGGAPIKETASIEHLIADTAEFALRGSNVRCDMKLPEDLWPVEVDEGQMSQVIQNLIINADQAMPQGGVLRIEAENVTVSSGGDLPLPPGKYVKVSFTDQGVGIPEEHLSKVFDPFFTTKQKGSGLGLATAYSVIKRHGGHITVKSTLGRGTTFTLYLPASEKPLPREVTSREEAPVGRGRVLLMDDEAFIRDVGSQMLTYLGYEVDVARDGNEAIALYREKKERGEPYDVVIMDLTVRGGMGGREAIKKLLAFDPQARAIVSSGYSNDPIMAEYARYGFRGVVAKPYKLQDLSRVLHQVMNGIE